MTCPSATHVSDSAAAESLCIGFICNAETDDLATCCDAREACSDMVCSAGWSADSAASSSAVCIGSSCDADSPDLETCCNENSCAAVSFGSGVVSDDSNSDGCTAGQVLTTSSDSTCDVKCDEAAYVAQSATVTRVSDASSEQATTGQPSCVARAACSTMTCPSATHVNNIEADDSVCVGFICN